MRSILNFVNLKLKPKLLYLYTFFKNISYLVQIFLTAVSHQKLEPGYSSATERCQGAAGTLYNMTQRKYVTPLYFQTHGNNYESKLSVKSHFNSNFPPTQRRKHMLSSKTQTRYQKVSYDH